jgi:hypothetical protein
MGRARAPDYRIRDDDRPAWARVARDGDRTAVGREGELGLRRSRQTEWKEYGDYVC